MEFSISFGILNFVSFFLQLNLMMGILGQKTLHACLSYGIRVPSGNRWHASVTIFSGQFNERLFTKMWVGWRQVISNGRGPRASNKALGPSSITSS